MNYKVYDLSGLYFDRNNLFKNKNEIIVISTSIFNEFNKIVSSLPEEILKELIGLYNIFMAAPQGSYEIYPFYARMLGRVQHYNKDNNLDTLAAALDYDIYCHPDETIFVTGDPDIAKTANYFFGEDSIILLKKTL